MLSQAEFGRSDVVVRGLSNRFEPVDVLNFEFWGVGWSSTTGPGSYVIDGMNYADCEICVLLWEDYNDGTPARQYFAISGGLEILNWNLAIQEVTVRLVDASLVEVTINPLTYESTEVAGGGTWCIESTTVTYSNALDPGKLWRCFRFNFRPFRASRPL